jgi:hypothetical protein
VAVSAHASREDFKSFALNDGTHDKQMAPYGAFRAKTFPKIFPRRFAPKTEAT